ncbi:hypothetical protein NIES4103_38590 [Nostoc sp. NIES-4103]|nr:hypothetical protein NIES4103_38590 [Nostoc sp. NIES-4103]
MTLEMILKIVAGILIPTVLAVLTNVVSNYIGTPSNKRLFITLFVFFVGLSIAVALFPDQTSSSLDSVCSSASISESEAKFNIGNTENQYLIPANEKSQSREEKIYQNNKEVKENNSYLLAVVVPAKERPEAAGAILAGVADAQRKFNQTNTDPTKTSPERAKFLKILVVDDDNNEKSAKNVACHLTTSKEWKNVVGVIGHHSSDASKAALDVYAKAGLAMITPTSTSIELKQDENNKVFFRVTSSNNKLGVKLAEYIKNQKELSKVVIYYDGGSQYSINLKQEFVNSFGKNNVLKENDIKPANFNEANVSQDVPNEAKAAIFFSSGGEQGTNNRAIRLISDLKINKRNIKLFGGESLYEGNTLLHGNKKIEDLILVVPWFPTPTTDQNSTGSYAEEAKKIWRGQINWRTAASYDATQAFLAAINEAEDKSKTVNRESVLESLPKVNIPAEVTSGKPLEFKDGEPKDRNPVLVKVVAKSSNIQCGFEVCFQLLEESKQ